MADADSMLLFEIAVEQLKVHHCSCKEFLIKARFMDLFQVNLRDPNDKLLSTKPRKNSYSKPKRIRNTRAAPDKQSETKVISGQSVLLSSNISHLIEDMKANPMEVSLWRRNSPTCFLCSTLIPWNKTYVDYLEATLLGTEKSPASMTEIYNLLSQYESKPIATIKLRVKLTHLRDSHKINFPHLKNYAILNNLSPGEDEKDVSMCKDEKNVKDLSIYKDEEKKTLSHSDIVVRVNNDYDNEDNSHMKTEAVENEGPKTPSLGDLTKPNIKKIDNEEHTLCEHSKETDVKSYISNFIKSETSIQIKPLTIKAAKSMTDYIFYKYDRPNTKQLYYVGYMSVAKDSPPSKQTSPPKSSSSNQSPYQSVSSRSDKYETCRCREVCPLKGIGHPCTTRCLKMPCSVKEAFPKPDPRIFLKMNQETVEKVDGKVKTKIHLSDSMCDCTCECTFGYTKTTYCKICKGVEVQGEDEPKTPFPCPIFHKLVEQKKDVKVAQDVNVGKGRRHIDVRFKFDYGYKAPKIGHANCIFPCGGGGRPGIDPNVPRHMGWLWNAENVPGLKFRPAWKPGAANKQVVRLLKIAKNPELSGKKKRKKQNTGKKRKNEKHALLIVHKKNGEYNVAVETMKMFPKPRALNQYPYEDKEPLTYTIGRTAEENFERKKVREKNARRLEAEKRAFIQKTFQNVCQDICVRTYRQALGILPKMEEPLCKCFSAEPPADIFGHEIPCPCSDDENLSNLESDTDSDEWIVEFTPPNANYDPGSKPKKITYADKPTQYSYLDYRVKLFDHTGAEIPRFFKGPDGKQQCSDLGGFWSPDHTWLEINIDGFIGPDQRWAPMYFLGPSGEMVEATLGKFQAADNQWYVIGVDGYVDEQGRWQWTKKTKSNHQKLIKKEKFNLGAGKDGKKNDPKSTGTSLTFFGNIAPEDLATLGIVRQGQDQKMQLPSKGFALPKSSTMPKARKKHIGGYDSRSYFDERNKCAHRQPSPKGVIAVDREGNKKYFKMKGFKNDRPKDRLVSLKKQGISLSSFHAPCFHSFMDNEPLIQQGMKRSQKVSHKPRTHFADTTFEYGTILQRQGY